MTSKKFLFIAILPLWATGVACGFVFMMQYEGTAGVSGQAPTNLPRETRKNGTKVLTLLAHPRCPCTRATLAELEKIMTRWHGRIEAHVCFLQPATLPADWSRGLVLGHRRGAAWRASPCGRRWPHGEGTGCQDFRPGGCF